MNRILLITVLLSNLFFLAVPAYAQEQALGLSFDRKNKKIFLDYKEANLVSVLQAIAYSFNLNLVITKDVQGKVTAYLQNITIDEALNAILSVNGYRFVRKGNVIYVLRANDMETVVEPFHLSFLTASDAKQLLSKIISKQGDIQINEATNSLVIVDIPENIVKIRKILSQMDVAPIQVLIEAKIVDIQTKEYENLGTTINSNFDTKGETGATAIGSTGGTGGATTGGTAGSSSNTATQNVAVATNLAGPSTDIPGNQINITPTFKGFSLNVRIDALVQQNKAHVLASPSIATLNGKEAKIVIGEHYPYLETTQTTVGNIQTSTQFIDVGTTLRVTPMVSPDGWITMRVHPEISSVSAALAAGPRITTQEADSTIRVRDNETIIIGGLINKTDNRTKSGIPFLRNIPVLGWLFSNRSTDRESTELTVFITPHIVRASSFISNSPDYAKVDITTQESLFAYINAVESDIDKSKPQESDLFKYNEILKTYQTIYRQYPDSPKADYCLFSIARIYNTFFHDPDAAQKAIKELLRKYPHSPYYPQAQEMDEPWLN